MRMFGCAALSEYLDDRIVYRDLAPVDKRIASFDTLRRELGLESRRVPRKHEPDYARVIARILQQARELDAPGVRLERMVMIGDTHLQDGAAFSNVCQATGWAGHLFIAAESGEPKRFEIIDEAEDRQHFLTNHWSGLSDFAAFCHKSGFRIDETCAVVVDMDKTAIGARGRNSQVIDLARVEAVYQTVAALLGAAFDISSFQEAYDQLNRVEFHPFTTDNQDYLAYICLILGSGLYDLSALVGEMRSGRLTCFKQFISLVDKLASALPAELAALHAEIFRYVQAGDPTPFKAFRRNEFLTTVRKMGCLADSESVASLLETEILITQEVRQAALEWRRQGSLLFGLSDKPPEASLPTPEQEKQGYRPVHQTQTHAVGSW